MEFILLFAIIALIVGVIIWGIHEHEKQRSEQFEAIAAQLGLEYQLKGDPSAEEAFGDLRLFKRGRSRKIRNKLSGRTEDIDLAVFGYRFTTGGGKNQQTHKQSVMSFRSPHLSLPEFELRPEGVFHKIGQVFGYKDIDFESNPEFSKRYLLRGPDEAAIRAFFTRERLQSLESLQRISVEANNDQLIVYRARKRIDPTNLQEFMEEGFRVFGLFKREPDS